MVSIDQVVGEIIVDNACVFGLIVYRHIRIFITMIIFLIGAVLTNPKQNDS